MIHVQEGHVQIDGDTATVLAEVYVLLYSLAKDKNCPLMGLQTAILDAFEEANKHV